jgi:hypothetical protein
LRSASRAGAVGGDAAHRRSHGGDVLGGRVEATREDRGGVLSHAEPAQALRDMLRGGHVVHDLAVDGAGGEAVAGGVDERLVRGDVKGKDGVYGGGVEEGHLGLERALEELRVDLRCVLHVFEEHHRHASTGERLRVGTSDGAGRCGGGTGSSGISARVRVGGGKSGGGTTTRRETTRAREGDDAGRTSNESTRGSAIAIGTRARGVGDAVDARRERRAAM